MKIQIQLLSLYKITNITLTEYSCLCNGKQKLVNYNDLIARLLNTVVTWKPKMINPEIIDGLSYKVTILKDGKTYNFEGQNAFPENFADFENIIKEIEG